jgi:hypothetical protein
MLRVIKCIILELASFMVKDFLFVKLIILCKPLLNRVVTRTFSDGRSDGGRRGVRDLDVL